MLIAVLSLARGYLAVTEEGQARLAAGGMEGAYLGPDGRVHIPGKRVTLYSEPSPSKEEMEQVSASFARAGSLCLVPVLEIVLRNGKKPNHTIPLLASNEYYA